MRQVEQVADQQEEGYDRKDPEKQDRVESLMGRARNKQRNQQDRAERVGQIDPPMFTCRVKAVHVLWRRDFSGASGLFSVVFKPVAQTAVNAFLDELSLFGIGASWGGFESLAIPFDCAPIRTATKWAPGGPTVRIHIGLEDIDDLIGDLERGFAAFAAAR